MLKSEDLIRSGVSPLSNYKSTQYIPLDFNTLNILKKYVCEERVYCFTTLIIYLFHILLPLVSSLCIYYYTQLDPINFDAEGKLEKIRTERGYSFSDTITISPEKLPNYEEKVYIISHNLQIYSQLYEWVWFTIYSNVL